MSEAVERLPCFALVGMVGAVVLLGASWPLIRLALLRATLFLNEASGLDMIVGAGLILAGAALASTKGRG